MMQFAKDWLGSDAQFTLNTIMMKGDLILGRAMLPPTGKSQLDLSLGSLRLWLMTIYGLT